MSQRENSMCFYKEKSQLNTVERYLYQIQDASVPEQSLHSDKMSKRYHRFKMEARQLNFKRILLKFSKKIPMLLYFCLSFKY